MSLEPAFDFMAVVNGPAVEVQPQVEVVKANDPDKACRILRRMYLPEIDRMKKAAHDLVVVDEETNNLAITMAGQAKKMAGVIEKKRKEVISEPYEFTKTVNTFVKVFSVALAEIEAKLKRDMTGYLLQVRMKQAEDQRRADDEARKVQAEFDERAAKGQFVAPVVAPAVIPTQKVFRSETGAAVHLRKDWKWEITEEMDIPRKYMVVDEVAVNKAVSAGIRAIPGLRIFELETAVIRS
jgi:hypothetical protein